MSSVHTAPAADGGRAPLSTARKALILALVVLIGAIAVGAYVRHALTRHQPRGEEARAPVTALLALPAAGARHVLYRSAALDDTHGRLALQPLDDGADAGRQIASLSCERVHHAAGRGLCLQADRRGVTSYRAVVFDRNLAVVHTLPLAGAPSRARVSADGRWGAMTVFVSGHSYASASFSTRTSILDMHSGQWVVEDLEKMTVRRDGTVIARSDFNFWGVSFAAGRPAFYATLNTDGQFLLVEGDLDRREMRVIAQGVECPSLSPDQTRVAFKRREPAPGGGVAWRPAVMQLASGQVKVLDAETRSVDDQLEWLDDRELAYELPADPQRSAATSDVWALRADGSAPPRLLVARASSPSAAR